MRARLFIAAAVLLAAPAAAADLTVARALTVVSDGTSVLKPKLLPGAVADYSLTVTNPLINGIVPVKVIRDVVIVDTIDPSMQLSVADYGTAGSGPVEFTDGGVLGLFGSGLTFAAVNVDYSRNGTTWGYVPVPVGGYDANVRAIRVRLTGTQAAGGSFRLRYRTKVR